MLTRSLQDWARSQQHAVLDGHNARQTDVQPPSQRVQLHCSQHHSFLLYYLYLYRNSLTNWKATYLYVCSISHPMICHMSSQYQNPGQVSVAGDVQGPFATYLGLSMCMLVLPFDAFLSQRQGRGKQAAPRLITQLPFKQLVKENRCFHKTTHTRTSMLVQ